MKKKLIIGLFVTAGLLLSANAEAVWKNLTVKYRRPSPLPKVEISPEALRLTCSQPSHCRAAAPYCWAGSCRSCTNPTVTENLHNTGYVRCDEGFCTNSGAAGLAAIFTGEVGEFQTIDCAAVPPPQPRESESTGFVLGSDEYTIGTIALPYEGQQLGSLKCDPGEVVVGIKVSANEIIRGVARLYCKPIDRLAGGYSLKTPSQPLGSSSGAETSGIAPSGSALVGFNLRYANTLEIDNRVGELEVFPGSLDTNPTIVVVPGGSLIKFGTTEYPYGGNEYMRNPWIRAWCPGTSLMTGVQVLYDSDSVKSVTPFCKRVYVPGQALATVPEGHYGFGKRSEVGYLGGRTISNGFISPDRQFGSTSTMCPPGSVMTGWSMGSRETINWLPEIYCQDINRVTGSCTADSREAPTDTSLIIVHTPSRLPYAPPPADNGRQGCAMNGFEYKQQKWGGPFQVVSELHSLLANRDQTQRGIQGRNFGQGEDAGYCFPHGGLLNCDATDWISVLCPPGSFMVGVKGMYRDYYYMPDRALGPSDPAIMNHLYNLGAYCREVVQGPRTEGTEPSRPSYTPATEASVTIPALAPSCTTDADCPDDSPTDCMSASCNEGSCVKTLILGCLRPQEEELDLKKPF